MHTCLRQLPCGATANYALVLLYCRDCCTGRLPQRGQWAQLSSGIACMTRSTAHKSLPCCALLQVLSPAFRRSRSRRPGRRLRSNSSHSRTPRPHRLRPVPTSAARHAAQPAGRLPAAHKPSPLSKASSPQTSSPTASIRTPEPAPAGSARVPRPPTRPRLYHVSVRAAAAGDRFADVRVGT